MSDSDRQTSGVSGLQWQRRLAPSCLSSSHQLPARLQIWWRVYSGQCCGDGGSADDRWLCQCNNSRGQALQHCTRRLW